jgi:hypothetical protein
LREYTKSRLRFIASHKQSRGTSTAAPWTQPRLGRFLLPFHREEPARPGISTNRHIPTAQDATSPREPYGTGHLARCMNPLPILPWPSARSGKPSSCLYTIQRMQRTPNTSSDVQWQEMCQEPSGITITTGHGFGRPTLLSPFLPNTLIKGSHIPHPPRLGFPPGVPQRASSPFEVEDPNFRRL